VVFWLVVCVNFFGLQQRTGLLGDYQALAFLSNLNPIFQQVIAQTARLSDSTHSNKELMLPVQSSFTPLCLGLQGWKRSHGEVLQSAISLDTMGLS